MAVVPPASVQKQAKREVSQKKKERLALAVSQSRKEKELAKIPSKLAISRQNDVRESSLRAWSKRPKDYVNGHHEQLKIPYVMETVISDYCLMMSESGDPVSSKEVLLIANKFLEELNKDVAEQSLINGEPYVKETLGKYWFQQFELRHPELKNAFVKPVTSARVFSNEYEIFKKWFDTFNRVITDYNIKDDNIYNMDEINVKLSFKSDDWKLIKSTDKDKKYKIDGEDNSDSDYVTLLETISKSGKVLEPLVLFKGHHLHDDWFIPKGTELSDSMIPHWLYHHAPNGFTTESNAVEWLRQIFIPQSNAGPNSEKVVLVLDNHFSHETPEFRLECLKNNIIPLYLPPHGSHLTQPLDQITFQQVRNNYRRNLVEEKSDEYGFKIKKHEFIKSYEFARKQGLKSTLVKRAWEIAGLSSKGCETILQNSKDANRSIVL
ncbi:uncharacterized protein KGF55_003947 [Candida pseudojiufengensis]|uniref:uncharacterized protein n=1 Tax=Candida pseudojiufengensis TaxID=497109 RepID=UPI002224DCE4|nr:uncharacterized protein KGF55_003947 [Candida pseudojiufengensis]KAI5961630.1 hypothetical protein KGF55_003947 [Candida pseudojiufengensis]